MKLIAILLISLAGILPSYGQGSGVEAVDKKFEEAYLAKNSEAMFAHVAPDCVFYGTAPTERWDKAAFRKLMENGFKNGVPAMSTQSKEIQLLNDGQVAVITKKVSWSVFKSDLREVAVYEKGADWKLKSLSISLTIPNSKNASVNQVLGSR